MGNYYGYNRVSTKEQNLDRGRKQIEEFCKLRGIKLEKIYEDKSSGKNFDRPRYLVLKEDVLRSGDVLIISEFDRLGRAEETKKELEELKEKNVRVIFLDIPTTMTDFSTLNDDLAIMMMGFINEMLISFYDLMAKAELKRKNKRQKEGIQALKDKGEWDRYGRPRKMDLEAFRSQYERVLNKEIGTLELMRELKLSKNTYFRYIKELKINR